MAPVGGVAALLRPLCVLERKARDVHGFTFALRILNRHWRERFESFFSRERRSPVTRGARCPRSW